MLIHLKNVLGAKELVEANRLLDSAHLVDGKLSAGPVAAQVKNNQEIAGNDPVLNALNQIVMGNLVRNKVYQRAALPRSIASPFYAVYEAGMQYGEHIDDPIMGQEHRYRSDLAMTIFLNNPEEYEGGELLIQWYGEEKRIKYTAGDAVLYPATTRHCVAEVSSGKRKVAVTWIHSLVKDNEQRHLLYELSKAREKLLRKQPEEEHTKQVDLVYVNLVRRWSEL